MWDDIQREYESTIKEIEYIAKKIQMLNLQYREFLASKEDIKNFMNNK
jgi:prefoldin subunit 5